MLYLFFQVFLDDSFFYEFKFLISKKWTVMFKNRNCCLQIQIPWVNSVLGFKFHETRSKTEITREEIAIFLTHPVNPAKIVDMPLHAIKWINLSKSAINFPTNQFFLHFCRIFGVIGTYNGIIIFKHHILTHRPKIWHIDSILNIFSAFW